MHVEDAAVFDSQFTPTSLRDTLVTSSLQQRENLNQLPAISAICNSATMTNVGDASETMGRKIMGDATDTAILRFSDQVGSSEQYREPWNEVFKVSFNSKVSLCKRDLRWKFWCSPMV